MIRELIPGSIHGTTLSREALKLSSGRFYSSQSGLSAL
jgi:hypothetical protein